MTFVGRAEQLAQLAAAVDSAQLGNGRFVLIRGEAGIGKTTLLKSFLDIHANDVDLLHGACEHLTTHRPLQPFYTMADAEPDITEALSSADAFDVSRALLWRLKSGLRTTVVAVDDAHWADQATLDVLAYVGRRIEDTHGVLVVIMRDEDTPVEHPLRGVVGSIPPSSTVRIALQPLDVASVAALAGTGDATELMSLTGGNPLLLTEYLRSDMAMPPSIEDLAVTRLKGLSPGARTIAEFVSVIPRSCPRSLLDASLDVVPADLDDCERSGLLVIDVSRVGYRHELIRRAVERSLGTGTRMALHQGIAEQLEESGADAATILHHANLCGDTDAIVRLSPHAVKEAMESRSYREAIEQLEALDPHMDRLEPLVRAEMLEFWSGASFRIGDIADALRTRLAAAELCRDHGTTRQLGHCMRPLSSLYWQVKEPVSAKAAAAAAVLVLEGDSIDRDEYAAALADQAFIFIMDFEDEHAGQLLEDAARASAGIDDPALDAYILATRCWIAPLEDQAEECKRAIELGKRSGSIEAVALASYLLPQVVDQLPKSERDHTLADLLTFAKDTGDDDVAAFTYLARGDAYWRTGDFTGAEDEARLAAEIWHDPSHNLAAQPQLAIGLNQARRGSPLAASTLTTAFDAAAAEPKTAHGVDIGLAEPYWLHGDTSFNPDRALAFLDDANDRGFLEAPDAWAAVWVWKLGLVSDVPALDGTPEGLLISGDWKGAAAAWDDPSTTYPRAVALSHGDTGERLEALAILDEMDAEPMRQRIRADLRKAGAKNIPRGRRRSTRDNPAGLTQRQADVMTLLRRGLTNRQIADTLYVSIRTVDHHVAAILSKLNATTRNEAVDIARDLHAKSR